MRSIHGIPVKRYSRRFSGIQDIGNVEILSTNNTEFKESLLIASVVTVVIGVDGSGSMLKEFFMIS